MILKNKGFTLIELMVVVAIIALLSSIVLASLGEAKLKAKDSKLIQEAHSLKNAIELYRVAKGQYPLEEKFNGTNNTFLARTVDNTEWSDFKARMAPYIDLDKLSLVETLGTYIPPNSSFFYDNVYDYRCGLESAGIPSQPPKGSYMFLFRGTPSLASSFPKTWRKPPGGWQTNLYCIIVE